MTNPHIDRIRELFTQLKKGHDWLQRHQDDNTGCAGLVDRSEPIFKELETLGVSKEFSLNLLVFGRQFTDELLSQMKPTGGEQEKITVDEIAESGNCPCGVCSSQDDPKELTELNSEEVKTP